MSNRADGQSDNLIVREEALLNMQKLYLEALRSRESEVLQFIVVLATGLGGFAWAMGKIITGGISLENHLASFVAIIFSILLLLMLGAMHALALSYNYRSIILQLRKLEIALHVEEVVLDEWRNIECNMKPPEIIYQFYTAYIWGIMLVVLSSSYVMYAYNIIQSSIVVITSICIVCMLLYFKNVYYSNKITDLVMNDNLLRDECRS